MGTTEIVPVREISIYDCKYHVVLVGRQQGVPGVAPHRVMIIEKLQMSPGIDEADADLKTLTDLVGIDMDHPSIMCSNEDAPDDRSTRVWEGGVTEASVASRLKGLLRRSSGGERIGHAVIGCIRFLLGFYLISVADMNRVANIGGRSIYSIDQIHATPLYQYNDDEKIKGDERRYLQIFKSSFTMLDKMFYFSFGMDMTVPLQEHLSRYQDGVGGRPQFERNLSGATRDDLVKEKFVFNAYILRPLLSLPVSVRVHWIVPIIQGAVEQRTFFRSTKQFSLTVIARRSRYCVGPRYFKRGVNSKGRVANEVECEQILVEIPEQSSTSSSQPVRRRKVASYVMLRGSIPLYWGHTDPFSMQPKVELHLNRAVCVRDSKRHFDSLFEEYGSPVVVFNLIKQKPPNHSETMLGKEFVAVLSDLQGHYSNEDSPSDTMSGDQSPPEVPGTPVSLESNTPQSESTVDDSPLPEPDIAYPKAYRLAGGRGSSRQLVYMAYDWLNEQSRLGFHNSLSSLFEWAKGLVDSTDFHAMELIRLDGQIVEGEGQVKKQTGVVRVNCIDCLDRTNLGMLAISQEALSRQLHYLNISITPDNIHIPHPIMNSKMGSSWRYFQDSKNNAIPLHLRVWGLDSRVASREAPDLDWGLNGAPTAEGDEETVNYGSLPGELLELLADLWGEVGDKVSRAYGGSEALHRAEFLIDPNDKHKWVSNKRGNARIKMRRYIHNVFYDQQKQRSLDLLMGRYRPEIGKVDIWDTQPFATKERVEREFKEPECTPCTPYSPVALALPSSRSTCPPGGLAQCLMTSCYFHREVRADEDADVQIPGAGVDVPIGRRGTLEELHSLGRRLGSASM
eukprot:GHVO01040055.1.p1 GENE.GHVO01040055.1~~GHVO01040055.1.p1  ORF type:complete len:848 (-),score=140.95 GHVO01040055.1:294-2837(-)